MVEHSFQVVGNADINTSHSCISMNLLVFHHECCPLIGYATHVLFKQ